MMNKPTIGLAVVLALVLAGGPLATSSVGQAPAGDPAQTALTSQEDTTLARRYLMLSIGANYDLTKDLVTGVLPLDEQEVRDRLASISAMLYAMPHLYRALPNPYTEEANEKDSARVSLSTEAVWENFDQFKSLMVDAFEQAKDVSEGDTANFKDGFEALGLICDTCHEIYRHPFETLDFDNPLGTGG